MSQITLHLSYLRVCRFPLHTSQQAARFQRTDFRMIPMGEIDLQHEIRAGNEPGLVYRQHQLGHARRMYSAKVEGRRSSKTVAIYRGDHAEEVGQICSFSLISPDSVLQEWRRDIANYMAVRSVSYKAFAGQGLSYTPSHPNIIQLHSAASSNNIHATVFYDGVIIHLKWVAAELET
jgi:hypothetical protein